MSRSSNTSLMEIKCKSDSRGVQIRGWTCTDTTFKRHIDVAVAKHATPPDSSSVRSVKTTGVLLTSSTRWCIGCDWSRNCKTHLMVVRTKRYITAPSECFGWDMTQHAHSDRLQTTDVYHPSVHSCLFNKKTSRLVVTNLHPKSCCTS